METLVNLVSHKCPADVCQTVPVNVHGIGVALKGVSRHQTAESDVAMDQNRCEGDSRRTLMVTVPGMSDLCMSLCVYVQCSMCVTQCVCWCNAYLCWERQGRENADRLKLCNKSKQASCMAYRQNIFVQLQALSGGSCLHMILLLIQRKCAALLANHELVI